MKTGKKSKITHAEIFSLISDRESSSVQGISLKPRPNKENRKVLQKITFLVHGSRIQPGKCT